MMSAQGYLKHAGNLAAMTKAFTEKFGHPPAGVDPVLTHTDLIGAQHGIDTSHLAPTPRAVGSDEYANTRHGDGFAIRAAALAETRRKIAEHPFGAFADNRQLGWKK